MPIFDFRCKTCAHEFEAIVREARPATCPSCHGVELERLISSFAVSSASTRQASLAIARKEYQRSKKDERIAHHEAVRKHDDH